MAKIPPATSVPAPFHPLVRRWFEERVGAPTEIQHRAWPVITEGRHALISAPTGSGKTLTAFLWALDQLLTGRWPSGGVRVLYISPLKALNTDIRRNLEAPLAELLHCFRSAGEGVAEIRAATRSGDTPAAERQKMLRKPPEILITTPESLNILLTSRGGRRLFGALELVIVDEIHAVAGNKRGTHLFTAVDRLVRLSGEFQRVGLSATVRPMERVAELLGGYTVEQPRSGSSVLYHRRPVEILRAKTAKRYDLKVCAPERQEEETFWPLLAATLRAGIGKNRSTLLFTNSRRMTERLTRLLNADQPAEVAYAHHGSLSREIREVVEQRLKAGELPAIVATSSLELGIDVGALDEVILLQTPPSVAATVQRLGRAGHQVGEVSRGRLYPLHEQDFLHAAVVAGAVEEGDIEEIRPIRCPLDVLAQVVLSMVVAEPWQADDLFIQLRASAPFRSLTRRQLELVLEMLAGRYADSRLRDLKPRLSYDRVDGKLTAHPFAARLLYTGGGTIPDRGYFHLRLADSKAKLGELDEEFVWERSVGDTFTLGAQSWRVESITHNDVLVTPAAGAASLAPFWRAEAQDRGPHLSQRIGEFLEEAEARRNDPAFREEILRRYSLEPAAAEALLDLLLRQRQVSGAPLPHRHHILVERYADPYQGQARRQILLHTLWGGRVNRPFAMALAAAWEEEYGPGVEILQEDDCINVVLPEGFQGDGLQLFDMVPEGELEALLRHWLERTGFFGARFRENAARALLLPRGNPRNRLPLWLTRIRSKKLLETVARYGDFPIVLETWRSCLEDEMDLDTLRRRLAEIREGEIQLTECYTQTPTPFAAKLIWTQTNKYMYEDDTPEGQTSSALRPDLLREMVFSGQSRPALKRELVARFEAKVQRLAPGYAPREEAELRDWVEERILIPAEEWQALRDAVQRDQGEEADPEGWLAGRAARLELAGSGVGGKAPVVALAVLPRIVQGLVLDRASLSLRSLKGDPLEAAAEEVVERLLADAVGEEEEAVGGDPLDLPDRLLGLVGDWVRFYGPFPLSQLRSAWGFSEEVAQGVVEALVENRTVVVDNLLEGPPERPLEICDSENLEILLRWRRAEARPAFEALPLTDLPLFLAHHQGLTEPGRDLEGLQDRLGRLLGYPAPASLWEGEILPARMDPYFPGWLDTAMQEGELLWLGCGRRRLTFTFAEELDLLVSPESNDEEPADTGEVRSSAVLEELFPGSPPRPGRFGVDDLALASGQDPAAVVKTLWRLGWEGKVSSDTFLPVRRGIEARFQPPEGGRSAGAPGSRRHRRGGGSRWRPRPNPFPGSWFPLPEQEGECDPLEQEERHRERVRLLLERYGVLFREVLGRELPPLQWSRLFRTLRLMELGGEILAGHFFQGIPGLQFASHAAFRALRQGLPRDAVYWFSAADPASLCGIELEELKGELPPRRPTHYVVYEGAQRVVTALRSARVLEITPPPGHPRMGEYLGFLRVLLGREQHPRRALEVEVINDQPVLESPYLGSLRELFSTTREAHSIKLRKRYRAGKEG